MTPESKARLLIDQKLAAAGWLLQDMKQINLGAGSGVAVREYPTDSGPADYVLFVDRNPVGVIEAKPDQTILTFAEEQTARYVGSALKWRMPGQPPLRFLLESTGQIIHFTDSLDPAPRAREIFHFFQPAHFSALLSQPDSLRRRLATSMPELPERNLRDCQVSAVTGLEQSLALNRPRALVAEQRMLAMEQQANVSHALRQSAAQRKNILQAAFSGQLVPQEPTDEPASALLARIRAERAASGIPIKAHGRKKKETS